jgi:hypothetical protein
VPRLAVGVVGDAEDEGAGAADRRHDAELMVREVLLPVDVAGGLMSDREGGRTSVHTPRLAGLLSREVSAAAVGNEWPMEASFLS